MKHGDGFGSGRQRRLVRRVAGIVVPALLGVGLFTGVAHAALAPQRYLDPGSALPSGGSDAQAPVCTAGNRKAAWVRFSLKRTLSGWTATPDAGVDASAIVSLDASTDELTIQSYSWDGLTATSAAGSPLLAGTVVVAVGDLRPVFVLGIPISAPFYALGLPTLSGLSGFSMCMVQDHPLLTGDLRITKTMSPAVLGPKDTTATFAITATNKGGEQVDFLQVGDLASASLGTITAVRTTQGLWRPGTGAPLLIFGAGPSPIDIGGWAVGALPPGGSATLTITVTFPVTLAAQYPPAPPITNCAHASWVGSRNSDGNNTSSSCVTVTRR